MLKGKLGALVGGAKKMLQKGTLKSVCAGAALVAFADGDVEASEIQQVISAVVNSAELSCFAQTEIEDTLKEYLEGLKRNVEMGRRNCYKQLETQLNDADGSALVIAVAQSVASVGGDTERQEVEEIRRRLRM